MKGSLPRTAAERMRRRKARRRGLRWAVCLVGAAVVAVMLGVQVQTGGGESPGGWAGAGVVRWAGRSGTGLGPQVSWGRAAGGDDAENAPTPAEKESMRQVLSPTIFALATPAGFTRMLGEERPAPPEVGDTAPAAAPARHDALPGGEVPALSEALGARPEGLRMGDRWERSATTAAESGMGRTAGVFDGRTPAEPQARLARMVFSAGWESRMFSGLALDYASWRAGAGWQARVEVEFDDTGVPVRVMLERKSGDQDVDARVLRGAYDWRLRDRTAPRRGTVAWQVPDGAAAAAAAAATTTAPAAPSLPAVPPVPGVPAVPAVPAVPERSGRDG